ncbi:MAG: type VI secretion system tube protein TssD [Xanthomonadales bacterium]|nr:type VI secretion system tube protein TssD [Xanthomonadales bacterium]
MALSIFSPPFNSNRAGEIKGGDNSAGMPDHVEWFALRHEITAPRHEATGLPTGKRQHGPVVVTKRLDRATPLLQDTLTKNGTIDEIKFLFYRPASSGAEEHHFTITLNEATIAGIVLDQLNNRYPEHMPFEVFETVSFTYDKITWEEVIEGTMAFDSWKATVRGG